MESVQTKFINQQKLPLVVEPAKNFNFEEFLAYIRANHEGLTKKLLTFGGILFRGFPVVGVDGFNAVVNALGLGKPLSYIGGIPHVIRSKGKSTPPQRLLPLL